MICDFARDLGDDVASTSWYQVLSGDDSTLEQCDLVSNLRVVFPVDDEMETAPKEELLQNDDSHEGGSPVRIPADYEYVNAIVLTQTCDLDYNKVDSVLVAKVQAWTDYVSASKFDEKNAKMWLERVQKGQVVHLVLMQPREEAPVMKLSVVNFRSVYSVDPGSLRRHVAQENERLRLTPPHREFVSQAFARCFMRVALEDDLQGLL